MKRHGVNASRPRSEVTPKEWFETYGSKPELREPPKRRHFAANTVAAETGPFRPCAASIFQREKRRVPREARLRLPWSVWADAHGFEFEFEFEVKDLKSRSGQQPHYSTLNSEMFKPMLSDLPPLTHPHPVMSLNVIKKSLQSLKPPRTP